MKIKNLNLNLDNLKKLKNKGIAPAICVPLAFSLTGCTPVEQANNGNYDIIDTQDTTLVKEGLTQVLDVDGEPFKLVIHYSVDLDNDDKWHITSDKRLGIEINTSDLPEGYEVYIDNIHTDTSIIATNAYFNGVIQDSMDDRIHNSQMIGFPINDERTFYGINEIEGQNQTFIQGTVYACSGYGSGSITERRFLESDYLEKGVYGNKISSVVDLLVHKEGMRENEYRAVSVPSQMVVTCSNVVEFNEGGKTYYRIYYQTNDGRIKYDTSDYDPSSNAKSLVKDKN